MTTFVLILVAACCVVYLIKNAEIVKHVAGWIVGGAKAAVVVGVIAFVAVASYQKYQRYFSEEAIAKRPAADRERAESAQRAERAEPALRL